MPQPKGSNGKSSRGHREDATLDLHDIADGLRQHHDRLSDLIEQHHRERRAVAGIYTLVASALTHLTTAQTMDDTRAAA